LNPSARLAEGAAGDGDLVEGALEDLEILEPLPSRHIPYATVDPFILVHEGVVPANFGASADTTHPHRGFDNLWYALSGSSSTGHSTGPGGTMERARLETGSLLKLRTGRGVLHPEALGEDEIQAGTATEMRSLLFWVNLARKDKDVEPTAQLLQPKDIPERHDGDATVRTLVGDGSPVELGTPGLILDVELPAGGAFSGPIPADFNGFVYLIEGEATFGANGLRASRSQIAVLGPGDNLTVTDAQPGTRFMLMAGKPYGETPVYNGPYVDRLDGGTTMTDYGHPITFGLSLIPSVDSLRETRQLAHAADAAGLDYLGIQASTIRRIYNVVGAIGGGQRGPGLSGDVATWVDTLTEWSVELGLDTFILWPTSAPLAQLQVFASEVVPRVRERVEERRRQSVAPGSSSS
jgi:redox-sensitive bicupin YhaK (pirin superfamily)